MPCALCSWFHGRRRVAVCASHCKKKRSWWHSNGSFRTSAALLGCCDVRQRPRPRSERDDSIELAHDRTKQQRGNVFPLPTDRPSDRQIVSFFLSFFSRLILIIISFLLLLLLLLCAEVIIIIFVIERRPAHGTISSESSHRFLFLFSFFFWWKMKKERKRQPVADMTMTMTIKREATIWPSSYYTRPGGEHFEQPTNVCHCALKTRKETQLDEE